MDILTTISFKWILLATVGAQIVGSIWYMGLFSSAYPKEMNMQETKPEQAKAMMPKLMIMEIITRLIYFVGLAILRSYTQGQHIRTVAGAYFLAVLTTEWSGTIRSEHSRKLWAMRAGKIALDTVIAVILYQAL